MTHKIQAHNNELTELSCEVINGIYVLLDMRFDPPKYVGLIKPKPFDKGYHYCPSVKSGLFFDCLRSEIPHKFRTAERAWKWTRANALRFKDTRKYTPFNPMIKWVAYAPSLFYLLRDFQLQLIVMKVMIGVLFGFYLQKIESQAFFIGGIVFLVIIGLTVITDIGLFIHKWRSQR